MAGPRRSPRFMTRSSRSIRVSAVPSISCKISRILSLEMASKVGPYGNIYFSRDCDDDDVIGKKVLLNIPNNLSEYN